MGRQQLRPILAKWKRGECGELYFVSGAFYVNAFFAIIYGGLGVAAWALGVGTLLLFLAIMISVGPVNVSYGSSAAHNHEVDASVPTGPLRADRQFVAEIRRAPRRIEFLDLDQRCPQRGELRVRYLKLEE